MAVRSRLTRKPLAGYAEGVTRGRAGTLREGLTLPLHQVYAGRVGDSWLYATTARLRRFADDRDWGQFHSPKNLAMALSVEVAELAEHFQWLSIEDSYLTPDQSHRKPAVEAEAADIAIYLLRLCDVLSIDLAAAVDRKITDNERRYPADEVRGSADKAKH